MPFCRAQTCFPAQCSSPIFEALTSMRASVLRDESRPLNVK